MSETQPAASLGRVRNVSDTARWAAYFRAEETKRPDAIFRDPFAERLCSQHGIDIANSLPDGNKHAWAWVTRTYLFDHFINQELQQGADLVLNLATGLDARPYRMKLAPSLQWIEVDLPGILDYKEEILANEKPTCALQRIRLDLADANARKQLFAELNTRAKRVLVLTEGLLIYLSEDEVAALARDLAKGASFQRWILDLGSPGLLKMMQKTTGKHLSEAGAPFKFAPAQGPEFFASDGWEAMEVKPVLQTAAQFKRPPLLLRLLARLPQRKGPAGNRPWSGVCLLKRE